MSMYAGAGLWTSCWAKSEAITPMKSIATDTDWIACNDPRSMIYFLLQQATVSDRKWRLSGVAWCRRIWHLLPDEQCKQAVQLAEALADSEVSQEEVRPTQAASWSVYERFDAEYKAHVDQIAPPSPKQIEESHVRANAALAAAEVIIPRKGPIFDVKGFPSQSAAAYALADSRVDWTNFDAEQATTEQEDRRRILNAEKTWQASILRHIFGNPFRPYRAPASWPSTVVQLAASLYQGQNCRLPLSDALEESGHQELAEHFRKEEWHPKGCFAMDLILDKT
jgi:hypothetical protein